MKKAQEELDQANRDRVKASTDDEDDEEDDEPEFFGNKDDRKDHPITSDYKGYDNIVIVKQDRQIEVPGVAGLTTVPHPVPVQAYNKQVFEKMTKENADGRTTFDDLGIKPTVLHDTRIADVKPKKKKRS